MPILSTFGSGSFAGARAIISGGGETSAVIGRYFYSTTDFLWSTLANWFGNSGHTTIATEYPAVTTATVLKSNCTLKLDGVADGAANYSDWQTASASYWAPPASIDTETNTLTFTSDSFYNGGSGVSEFIPGTGHRYELNAVVSYVGTYYQAIRTAQDTGLVSNVPDPYYWAVTTQPSVNLTITGTGAIIFRGVNNLSA